VKKMTIALAVTLFLTMACITRKSEQGGVAPAGALDPASAKIYQTAQSNGNRLADLGSAAFEPFGQPLETQPCIFIDPTHTFQTLVGIGGALTDAAAETFFRLPEAKQQELLTAYFDAERGIGYTLARTNIQSCDFSSGSYEYVQPEDRELKSFSIDHDRQFKIPFIKKSISAAGGALTLYASPWSPPAWMKTNNNMLRGGKLKPDCYEAWAGCYIKFIQAYEEAGIPVWGLSVQNEPMATQTWESCIYTGEEERDFVKNHLGPVLAKAGMSGKKLIVWDHNRDLLYQRASTVLNDPEAARYVWGVGFHWYINDC